MANPSAIGSQVLPTTPASSVTFTDPQNPPTLSTDGTTLLAKYPANLWTPPFDKWMMFSAMSGRHVIRNQVVAENNQPDTVLASVGLYLPEDALVSQLGVAYDQTDLGPMVGAAVEFFAQTGTNLAGAKGGGSALDNLTSALKSFKANAPTLPGTFHEAFKADLQSLLADLVGETGEAATAIAFGQRVNPRTAILFNSAEYRTHTMTFLLVPRTLDEAQAIDTICGFFTFYMLPHYQDVSGTQKAGVGAFMVGFPYEFLINMYGTNGVTNTPLAHINKIGRSVLKNVQIDHAAGGKTAFIKTNGDYYPVATKITLTFQEVNLLDRTDAVITYGSTPLKFQDPRS